MKIKKGNDYKRLNFSRNEFDIIGDIHGCYYELLELLEKLGYQRQSSIYVHPQGRRLISVGDIGDKGPENIKTIRFWLRQVQIGGALWVYGNHCNKLYRYFLGNRVRLSHGLEKTAAEFRRLNSEEQQILKNTYMDIYNRQSYYLILDNGNLVVVHGGIRKENIGRTGDKIRTMCLYGDITGESDERGKPIRRDWGASYTGTSLVVYGHTVTEEPYFVNNTIDIDQGCVYGGRLTAFRYPEREVVQVKGKPYTEYLGTNDVHFL